jgi:chromosome segregation ATPase
LVEQLVAFALGFCICGLIALAFLPLVSARARRLTLKRIEERLPMTFDEIEADRDLLRARYAVEKRDLEVALEHERESRAGDSAELGRRAAEIVLTQERLRETADSLSARDAQLAQALEQGETLRAELAETRQKLEGREAELRKQRAEFDALAQAHRALHVELEQARARLRESEGRNERFEARRERLVAKIEAERKRVEEVEAEARALRQGIAQGGGMEMADLRAAILDIGRQVAAHEQV